MHKRVIAVLLALWISALIYQFELERVFMPVIAVIATVFFDLIVSYIRKKQWVWTLSSIVTGLLIGLITDGITMAIAACFIASFSKQFIGAGDHRHIFNPAALGILTSSLIFQRPVAWWAASWGVIPAAIIAVGMISVLDRLHRFWMSGIFLLIYVFITRSLPLIIDGTVFLFAFVMLPEPVTSYSGKFWRYGWGALVGGFVAIQTLVPIVNADPLLTALLAANLVGYTLLKR